MNFKKSLDEICHIIVGEENPAINHIYLSYIVL